MFLQPLHQLFDIFDKRLGFTEFLQLRIIGFVRYVSFIVLDVNDHGIEFGLVHKIHELIHSGAACAISRYINAFDFGSVNLRIDFRRVWLDAGLALALIVLWCMP